MVSISRIKELRKLLNLTQESFSKKINISQSNLSNIENGTIMLTDRVKNTIFKEFNVNPDWFETGQGNAFNDITEELINRLSIENSLDDIDKNIICNFINLNDNKRKQVLGYMHRLLEKSS
ncbi:helix-turn-helix domain-containing protein [Vallitalea guaymasensis]|uniref:helix-turn-helix domain-containing protein n=1 Tax=Vallitalea guaymasensis TaxID=1185412 RepID=UPI0023EB4B8C|nr:helix-turn-helix transcriptional regulator [Vallitalea guaymasensis]